MKLLHDHTYEVELVFTPLKGFAEKALDRGLADALYDAGAPVDDVGVYKDLGNDTLSVRILLTVDRRAGVDGAKLDAAIVDACAANHAEAEEVGEYVPLEDDDGE